MPGNEIVLPVRAKDETRKGTQSARRNFQKLGDGASKDLNKIGTAAGRQVTGLDRIGGSVRNMVAGFAGIASAGAIIGGITSSVRVLAQEQAEVTRQAQRYNAEAAKIAGQARHFRVLGHETQDLSDLYETLIERVGELNKGEALAVEHFRNMGLAADDFIGLDVTGQVVKVAEALRAMNDETARSTEAYALFGGDAKALLDIVATAPDQFDDFRTAVGEVNPQLAEQARLMRELDESWKGFLATVIAGPQVGNALGRLSEILRGDYGYDYPGAGLPQAPGPSANQVATSFDLVHLNRRTFNRAGSRRFGSTGLGTGPVDAESEMFGLGGPSVDASGTSRTAAQVAAFHEAATKGLNDYTDSLEKSTGATKAAADELGTAADKADLFGGKIGDLGGQIDTVTNSQVQGLLGKLTDLGGEFEALGGPILDNIQAQQDLAEVEQARATLAQAAAQAMAAGNDQMAASLSQMASLLENARSLSAAGGRSRRTDDGADLDDGTYTDHLGRQWGPEEQVGKNTIRRFSNDNDDPYSYRARGWIKSSYLRELESTQDFGQDRDKINSVTGEGVTGLLT